MVKKKGRKEDSEAGPMIGFSMATFLDMADRSGLISIPEAAQIRGCSRAAIQHLIERGRLTAHEVFGKTMVFRHEVENFERRKSGPKGDTE